MRGIRTTIFIFILAVTTLPSITLHGQTIIYFQQKENEKKTRHLKIRNPQYLKIKTFDSTYIVDAIVDITDSVIVAQNRYGTFSIRVSKIKSIRKKLSILEGSGRWILGLSSVGIVVGVPVIWIEEGAGKIGERIIGTVILAASSVPMIFISKWATQVNMKKWKITSFSNVKYK